MVMLNKVGIMKEYIVLITCLVVIALTAVSLNKQPKYVYPVREGIINTGSSISWDQYCWYEYDSKHIDKVFIGRVVFNATVTDDSTFTISSCSR